VNQFVGDHRRRAHLVPRQLRVGVNVAAQVDHPVHDAVKGAAHPLWVPCQLHRPTVWAAECGYGSTSVATTRSAVVSVRRTALGASSSLGPRRRPDCPPAFQRRYHRSRTGQQRPASAHSSGRDAPPAGRTPRRSPERRAHTPQNRTGCRQPGQSGRGTTTPRPAATHVSISSSVVHTIAIGTQPFRAPSDRRTNSHHQEGSTCKLLSPPSEALGAREASSGSASTASAG
jgi:hypothetical protein